jgi:hypothetical protein
MSLNDGSFLKEPSNHKVLYGLIGFLIVFAIIFSFQYMASKNSDIKNNYLSLFCANIKNG